ncbi:MAG: hypothetical protein KF781_02595 [Chitinophagaceae bacterium]|nr:hypothetical protein [Chitinophagaceae bacterium]MCW5904399.1 hypothetical protein [Chitinophagaceae bacterium]
MRYLFLCLVTLIANTLVAQEDLMPLQISAQGNTIRAILTQTEKVDTLFLKMNKKETGKLVIMNGNAKTENNFKREYLISQESNKQSLRLTFLSRVVGITTIMLKELFTQTTEGNVYNLYTITTSENNSEEAQKILLCKIVIR